MKNFDKEVNRKVIEVLRIRSIVTVIEFISKRKNVKDQCKDFGIPKSNFNTVSCSEFSNPTCEIPPFA